MIKKYDISEDEKINELIISTSIVCAAIATQPFPGWDIFLLTPVQIYLGQVRKAKIDSFSAIYEIAGAIGLGITAQQSIIFLYKFIFGIHNFNFHCFLRYLCYWKNYGPLFR